MSEPSQPNLYLTRRHWLALAASAVSGCGGGSGVSTASLPGTGGTGYTQGSISGFGSVFVNGVEFDDVMASANGSIQIDGVTVTSDYLRLGMVAGVQSERGVDPAPPTVRRIDVWSIAQGSVLQIPRVIQRIQRTDGTFAESAEFTVAGMTVQTDPNTSFYGVAFASDLMPNQVVMVWGLQAGTDGAHWTATRVEVRPMGMAMNMVSTGVVYVSGSQRLLNGLSLSGSTAGTLTVGALVRVQGTWSPASNSLAVEHSKLLGSGLVFQPPGHDEIEVEIEGFVTDTPTASGFMLGNIVVDASAIAPISTQIKKGARVEVHGTWQSGVLKATKVELEAEQTLQTVELKGVIEVFTSKAEFWVRGQRCDASGITKVEHGTVADLKQGVEVKLKGSKAGDVVMVTQLEIAVDD